MNKHITRPLNEIASDIIDDWYPVNYAAQPYLRAMCTLSTVSDHYGFDSGASIVRYFLANAGAWRGPKAREIKAELKALLKH